MPKGFRVRPAVVSGLVVSGGARVVSDGRVVVVVTAQGRHFFRLVSQEDGASPNKRVLTLETESGDEGVLTVVLSGGCSCGKPWLKKPSDSELLLKANQKFPVEVIA